MFDVGNDFSCQSSYVLLRLRLCRTSDTVFRREIDSQRQWGYGTCYGGSFPAAKECRNDIARMIKRKSVVCAKRIEKGPIPCAKIILPVV